MIFYQFFHQFFHHSLLFQLSLPLCGYPMCGCPNKNNKIALEIVTKYDHYDAKLAMMKMTLMN